MIASSKYKESFGVPAYLGGVFAARRRIRQQPPSRRVKNHGLVTIQHLVGGQHLTIMPPSGKTGDRG